MRRFFLFSLLAGFLLFPFFISASSELILFYGRECSHCEAEIEFLSNLKKDFPDLKIILLEVWHNEENQKLFAETADKMGIKQLVVPLTVVGDKHLIGFDNAENSGQKIRKIIEDIQPEVEEKISHPIFGKINIKSLSLPVLSIVLGTLDGFNPCSMWVMFTLLTLIIATGSPKKVWLIGGIFIFISALVYFIFISVWLNLFILVDYLILTRVIVGLIAVVAGVIFIKKFYTFKPDVCEVSSPGKQQKITEKIKKILNTASLPLMIFGLAVVAVSVNLIEILCSLGIPVVFTKMLSMNNLTGWQYYVYIGLYDFFYMIDEIFVLVVAGISMKFFHFNSKYSKYSHLIGGVLMLILGLIFLFKPSLLMF